MSVADDPFDECLLARLKSFAPELGVVLGSGFGDVADALEVEGECPFSEVGGIASSTVPGHAGRFVWGQLGERRVLLAQGRIHLYEGHEARDVTVLVRLMHAVGVRRLMLTNAAGALNANFGLGHLMVLSDHINFTGTSPLNGAEGFISMVDAYCPEWRKELFRRAAQLGMSNSLHSGVYAGLRG
ncbi:purine-nucleoside phosphorylase, partial [bacterium]|nr:purine-nucleoside phosphorylase [bacterium]